MKYAVIAISGAQYLIEENQTLTVDKLGLEDGATSSTDQVLLLVDDKEVKVGKPLVENASVEFKVEKNYQGTKIKVFRYKGKSRYRKTRGFRAQLCNIKILSINSKI